MSIHNFNSKNKSCQFSLSENITFGKNIVFGPNCKNITIGYGCFLGNDLYIDVPELVIGDYTTIHHGTIIHGLKTHIGHNCWIGHYCIIDSLGGDTIIGNNVGVGAHSQLWSHMKFGDLLEGCLWNSTGKLHLKDDVWLVGHTIIGPITAEAKSMLLTGGVMMKNMKANQIYSGNPAVQLEKLGTQFTTLSIDDKKLQFINLIDQFQRENYLNNATQFEVVDSFSKTKFLNGITQFNLIERTYLPQYSHSEYKLMKFLLYDKAKFIPVSI